MSIIKRHASGLIQAKLVDELKGEEQQYDVDGAQKLPASGNVGPLL